MGKLFKYYDFIVPMNTSVGRTVYAGCLECCCSGGQNPGLTVLVMTYGASGVRNISVMDLRVLANGGV